MRRRTLTAMAFLSYARLLIALVPLHLWRHRFGLTPAEGIDDTAATMRAARLLARHVERAARRLPFARKCLPRAMALSMLLRRGQIAHAVVIAVGARGRPNAGDRLHAWVEHGGMLLLGDEPGPWTEILRLPSVRDARR